MNIEWPNAEPEELPDDLSKDKFYECVTATSDEGQISACINIRMDIDVPLPLLLDEPDVTPEDMAECIMQRMLLDLNVDILPLLTRRLRDAMVLVKPLNCGNQLQ
jgi:hypothetical protein